MRLLGSRLETERSILDVLSNTFWDVSCLAKLNFTYVSVERATSIFRVDDSQINNQQSKWQRERTPHMGIQREPTVTAK
jgi:hypothetical protein